MIPKPIRPYGPYGPIVKDGVREAGRHLSHKIQEKPGCGMGLLGLSTFVIAVFVMGDGQWFGIVLFVLAAILIFRAANKMSKN
jgi:hypothetical protein